MKRTLLFSLFFVLCFGRCVSFAAPLSDPIATSATLIEAADGYVAAEAEHFVMQEKTNVRAWYLTTSDCECRAEA